MKSTNRKCSYCKKKILSQDAIIGGLRAFCSYDHLNLFMQSERGKQVVKKAQREELREVRKKAKTISDYKREAQAAFNAYIRIRDQAKPCISCGNNPESVYGGGVDAGHYRSRGASPHLAFHLLNCHAQCKKCNRYLSGNVSEYRKGLRNRIGDERLEQLETTEFEFRPSKEYLERVKKIFNKRARIYKRLFRP